MQYCRFLSISLLLILCVLLFGCMVSSKPAPHEILDNSTLQQSGIALTESANGVLIKQVMKPSPWSSSDIRKGDIIVELNHTKLTSPEDFIQIANRSSGKFLLVIRRGSKLFYTVVDRPTPVHNITPGLGIYAFSQTATHQLVDVGSVGTRRAVIIGVSAYQDTRISALRYAVADAQAFYDWIVSSTGGKYAPFNVRLLIGRDATLASIKRTLFNWLKQALEEDVVTIYFAGHGSPESPDYPNNLFLLPYDAKYDDIATTSFPMWDIETALKRFIKAKKIVVLADACHSGGVGQSFDIARRANRGIKINPISSGILNLSQIGDGVCVISASDDKQFSQESQKWGGGHGVLTYFLLRGLNSEADYNKDSSVTLGELTSYLSEQVRRETNNAQSPTVAGRYDPAMTIER